MLKLFSTVLKLAVTNTHFKTSAQNPYFCDCCLNNASRPRFSAHMERGA